MRSRILVALWLGVAACGSQAIAAGSGGLIVGATVTNSQMWLLFQTASGCSYQVQNSPTLGSRFWMDPLPSLSATGSQSTALVPVQASTGFFRVLEFTNRTFWYDWAYYYETPWLSTWGLGATQTAYAHLDPPYDWYIDQADTGASAAANCGPSSVTMADQVA